MGHWGSFCRGLAQILRKTAEHGSLYAAGNIINIAYSKLWKLVKEAQKMFGVTFVSTNGAHGSELTADGRLLLEVYEELERECQEMANKRFVQLLHEKRAGRDG
jgi:molybdate transport system regulatory protein